MTDKRRPRKPAADEVVKTFSIRIPVSTYQELGHFGVDALLPLNEVIKTALQEWLATKPDPKKYARPS